MIRDSLSRITNTAITDVIWTQASLPVSRGGLGIRSIVKLALPAFLASAYSVAPLASAITNYQPETYCSEPTTLWQQLTNQDAPPPGVRGVQKAWDEPIIRSDLRLLERAFENDIASQARMLAVSTKEAGAWLQALPAASLGNLLNDSGLRTAVALRLGAPVCTPHQCICGDQADEHGYHGSSCKFSAGRKPTHESLKAVIKRAFASAGIETELEPPGISRTDGKRPDGVTISPWERGKALAWDVTCRSTMALSYIAATSTRAGAAAALAERSKTEKYRNITQDYWFKPLAFETYGTFGPETTGLLTVLGKMIQQQSGEPRALEFLRQRISIEIQRGNAASIMGTAPPTANLDEIFSVIRPPVVVDVAV
ncbi:uncharacterized protein LOC129594739 [Paramacrobiotus metropolitanus]|uniref:uncharacterized protein LOC129594739 n=1 Tax=Paramacrobiotus metropolitanus TaxID=2943436 RepID=UPI002445AAC7|nr:uncharacterized protein LOC129594739 [Paramacrobiotus metropolitanus]